MSTTNLVTIMGAAGSDAGAGPPSLLAVGSTSYTSPVVLATGSQNRDSSGNFLIATTCSEPTIYGYKGVGSLSVAPDGNVKWQRNFDGVSSNDECTVQIPDGSGNVYNFSYGFPFSSSPTNNAAWCMKINQSTGVCSDWWKFSYDSNNSRVVAAYYVSPTVVYVVINDYNGHVSAGHNVMFGTFNPSTNTLTDVRYWGGSNNNGTSCTAAICDGTHWYVRMTSAEVQAGTQDVGGIGKFTVAGVNQWWRTYGTASQNNYGTGGIDIDSSGNVYSAYRYRDTAASYWAVIVQKHNSSGTLQWEKRIQDNSGCNGIYVDGSGRLFVSGNYRPSGVTRFFASELNPSNGDEIWTNRLVPGSSPTGTWSTSSSSSIRNGGISEDNYGNLVLMPICSNSNFWYSAAGGFFTGIDKDGTSVDLGTELTWETATSFPWTAYTSNTFSTSALTSGTVAVTVTYYSSLPTNMGTSTIEFGTVVVQT